MSLTLTFNESVPFSTGNDRPSSSSHNVVHSRTPIPTTTNSTHTSSASSSINVPSSSYITVTVTDHDTPLISSTYIPKPSSPSSDTGVIVSAVLTVVMVGGLLVVAFIFVRRARRTAISQKENFLAYPEKPVWEPHTWRREVYATMSDKRASSVSRSPSNASAGTGHYKKSRIQIQPSRERTDIFS